MQAITVPAHPPLPHSPSLPSQAYLCCWQRTIQKHCSALFAGGARGSASLPQGKVIKWIVYIHAAEEIVRGKTLIAHWIRSLRATDHWSHLWNISSLNTDIFRERSSVVAMCRSEQKNLRVYGCEYVVPLICIQELILAACGTAFKLTRPWIENRWVTFK